MKKLWLSFILAGVFAWATATRADVSTVPRAGEDTAVVTTVDDTDMTPELGEQAFNPDDPEVVDFPDVSVSPDMEKNPEEPSTPAEEMDNPEVPDTSEDVTSPEESPDSTESTDL